MEHKEMGIIYSVQWRKNAFSQAHKFVPAALC